MNFADLLTYADIGHLKRMASHYHCGEDFHSKGDLITSLLHHLGHSSRLVSEVESLKEAEVRFLEQLCFDNRDRFSQEELISKGRAALGEEKESPRSLVVAGLNKGWLFPGVHGKYRTLYQVPSDLRHRFLRLFVDRVEEPTCAEPVMIRNEEGMMVEDLHHFLQFLREQKVLLTGEGGIYRQQQRQLFKRFYVSEEPVARGGWRFGFGRRYHLYPDRFSLLYDYAFYRGYILEEGEERLCLSTLGMGKIHDKEMGDGKELYRFWIRLYKKPIPQLPIIIRWVDLLSHGRWFSLARLEKAVSHWLQPFYYETPQSLFQRVGRMLMHLGLLSLGRDREGNSCVRMNQIGHDWLRGVSGFKEQQLDRRFNDPAPGNKIGFKAGNKGFLME